MRVCVVEGDNRGAPLGNRHQGFHPAFAAVALHVLLPGRQIIVKQHVRAGHVEHIGKHPVLFELLGGLKRFRQHGTRHKHMDDVQAGLVGFLGLPIQQPIAALKHLLAQVFFPVSFQRHIEDGLVQRLGREPQISTLAAVPVLEFGQRRQENPFQLKCIGRFVIRDSGQLDPDARRNERLVGPAFGAEADARGRADDDESGLRIGRVNKGVERPTHKRIVDRAYRQQGLPV